MIYNNLYDLEGFIRVNSLNDLKTKNFNFKENDIVFVIENFTFYNIKNISEETNTIDEVEVNSNFKGIKLETISKISDLEKIDLVYPKQSEQKRMSTYFCKLDHLISLHQRKLEKLKNIKKSMLEKMFI